MKILLKVAFLLVLRINVSAEEQLPITVVPITEASVFASPQGSANAGKQWMTRKFKIKNTSGRNFFIFGHSLDDVVTTSLTKDPGTGKWVRNGRVSCMVGASPILVVQGSAFTATVTLPIEMSDREFVIEFTRGIDASFRNGGETTRSLPLCMKPSPKAEQVSSPNAR